MGVERADVVCPFYRYDDGYNGYVDEPNYLCWEIKW